MSDHRRLIGWAYVLFFKSPPSKNEAKKICRTLVFLFRGWGRRALIFELVRPRSPKLDEEKKDLTSDMISKECQWFFIVPDLGLLGNFSNGFTDPQSFTSRIATSDQSELSLTYALDILHLEFCSINIFLFFLFFPIAYFRQLRHFSEIESRLNLRRVGEKFFFEFSLSKLFTACYRLKSNLPISLSV